MMAGPAHHSSFAPKKMLKNTHLDVVFYNDQFKPLWESNDLDAYYVGARILGDDNDHHSDVVPAISK